MEKRPEGGVTVPESNPAREYLATKRSTTGEPGAATRASRLTRDGQLFGPVFGLLWLAYPIYALLTSNPSLVQLIFALVGTALFAGILWLLWLHGPLRAATAEASEVCKRRVAIASLAALVLALTLVGGNQ